AAAMGDELGHGRRDRIRGRSLPEARARATIRARNLRKNAVAPDLWYALATVLILAGLAGTVLPVIPGAPLMFLGMAVVAWVDGFQRIGWITLAVLAGLTALSVVTDFAAGALGAKGSGASRIAFLGAALGALVGVFFGPFG